MSKTYVADGSLYKVGVHNKVYRWNNHEWVSSTKTIEEMKEQAKRSQRSNVNRSEEAQKNHLRYLQRIYIKNKKEKDHINFNKASG